MKLVVDTNILFSALLKEENKELDIILGEKHDLFVPKLILIEIFKHRQKLIKISSLSEDDLIELYYTLLKRLKVVNEENIPVHFLDKAYKLTKDIDPKDSIFVASALFLDAKLWTGDKKLCEYLALKNYFLCISTRDLLSYSS